MLYNFEIPKTIKHPSKSIEKLQKYFDRKIECISKKIGSNDSFQELLNVYKTKINELPDQCVGILISLKTIINQILSGKYVENFTEPLVTSHLNLTPEEIINSSKNLVVLVDDDRELMEEYRTQTSKISPIESESEDETKCIYETEISVYSSDEHDGNSESDPMSKKIAQYEMVLKKIEDKIKFYEEKDIGLDEFDKNDTPYLRLDILKRQFIKVWKRYTRLCDEDFNPEKAIKWKKIRINYSNSDEINHCINRLVNKENQFPDYNDIYEIVKRHTKDSNTNIESSAKEIFRKICISLKKRRIHYYEEDFGCHLTDEIDLKNDPYSLNSDLKQKIKSNRQLYDKKMDDLMNEFSNKQTSSVHDEHEEHEDDCSELSEDVYSVETAETVKSSNEINEDSEYFSDDKSG